jgi:uncharacterized protein YdaU (DUF1376 family)
MHYYQFNIGDYQSHTAHLTETEDLAYRRMLDWCYLHEKALPVDPGDVARLVRMRSHSKSIAIVLQEYFERREEGWIHLRVIQEITKVGQKSEKASESAKARWSKPKDANALPTQSDGYATRDPLPITQDPLPKTHKKNTVAPPIGVTESVWQDWLSLRKTKKAAVTQTAIDGIAREASKAGVSLQTALETCCARGWTGFKADWLKDKGEQKSFAEKDYDFKRARWEAMTGRTQGEEMKPFLELEDDTTH